MPERRTTRSSKPTMQTKAGETPVQLGWLGDTVGFSLRLAQNASFQAFSALAVDQGLRPARYAMLQVIHDNPGIGQTLLSQAVGREKSTLTPLVAELERRKLLTREPDPVDRRGRRLFLTEAGVKELEALRDCARRHEERLDALLGTKQKKTLIEMLRFLSAELGRDPRDTRDDEA